MAKKSTATRQANAARRSQTTSRPSDVTLVRTPKPAQNAATGAAPAPVKSQAVAAKKPAAAPHAAPPVNRPRALEVTMPNKPAAPKPAPAPAQQQAAAKVQAARIARAKATQRARTGNVITPEHYSYVINDLKWIGGLAFVMFATIIVLHFALPA
jgi:TPP-dependent indolepyruvate ferredoxin oxidoreductase alpha subunit